MQNVIEKGAKDFDRTKNNYKELYDAVSAGDTDQALKMIADMNGTAGKTRLELLLKPVGEHVSTFQALLANSHRPEEEAALISRFIEAIGNDSDALTLMGQIAKGDGPEADKYKKYLAAFAGVFVPVNNNVINVNMCELARYSGGKLKMLDAKGGPIVDVSMDAHEAAAILKALKSRPNFIQVGDQVTNLNMCELVRYSDSRLKMLDSRGNSIINVQMNADDAKTIFDNLKSRPNFIQVGDEIVNVNMCELAMFTDDKLKFLDARGNPIINLSTDADEAEEILKTVKLRPNFIQIRDKIINTNMCERAEYNGYNMILLDPRGGRIIDVPLNKDEGLAVIEALKERLNFIQVGNYIVNTNMCERAEYTDVNLEMLDSKGGRIVSEALDSEDNKAVQDTLRTRPNFIEVGKYIVNTNMCERAEYTGINLKMLDRKGGRIVDEPVSAKEAAMVLDALKKRPNFIQVGKYVVNVNMCERAEYVGSNIKLLDSKGGAIVNLPMDKHDAYGVLNHLRKTGQIMAVGQMAGSAEQLQFALRQSREWGSSYPETNSAMPNNSMLMYMLVAQAILLSDSDPSCMAVTEINPLDAMGQDICGVNDMLASDNAVLSDSFNNFTQDTVMDMNIGGGMDMTSVTDITSSMGSDMSNFISCDPALDRQMMSGTRHGPQFI